MVAYTYITSNACTYMYILYKWLINMINYVTYFITFVSAEVDVFIIFIVRLITEIICCLINVCFFRGWSISIIEDFEDTLWQLIAIIPFDFARYIFQWLSMRFSLHCGMLLGLIPRILLCGASRFLGAYLCWKIAKRTSLRFLKLRIP